MISAIVLAAGESRRMGRQKVLLPWGDRTVLEQIVDVLNASGVDEIIVVAGHRHERISEVMKNQPVQVVVNPDFHAGMLSSIRCGLRAVSPNASATLLALGDQPSIHQAVVQKLLEAYRCASVSDPVIVVPTWEHRRGHPMVFSNAFRDEILRRFDAEGLRGLLQAFPDAVREVPVDSATVVRNMNFPADYERELQLRSPSS